MKEIHSHEKEGDYRNGETGRRNNSGMEESIDNSAWKIMFEGFRK